ncbi:MAG: hypothetical protein IJR52_09745 [Selenomonadaceae bacterium]|nr:hypothetical protein [Selenomonadaceae bacterium]
MLESVPLEEVVEHTVDAVANDGATYSFKEPNKKVCHVITSLPSAGKGFTALMWRFYNGAKIFSTTGKVSAKKIPSLD